MTVNLRSGCVALGKEYATANGLVIGRDSDCDIVYDCSEISRRHARLNVAGFNFNVVP
ncbi:MAG: FHA domain-containing protein [Halieaceae bacterium]